MAQVWFTCVVAFLCCLPLLNACTWDPNTDVEQSLDFTSYDNGAAILAYLPDISNAEECQRACCDRDVCQLALIGTPADGKSECRLVSCVKDGVDVCVLKPSTQFKVFRKIDVAGDLFPHNESEVRAAFTTDDCRLPSVVGNCRAAFPRFYYNVTSQTCQQFVYGGCGGNNNNFETQEACETLCSGVKDSHAVSQRSRMSNPEDISADEPKALPKMTSEEFEEKCLAPSVTGRCRASIRRYFYNKGTCEQFIYGGCRGNKNNYETEEACMTTCTVTVVSRNEEAHLEPVAPVTPSSPNQEACSAPAESGPCRAAFPVFYFESSTQSCKPFIYGGCQGNQNRYGSEEECMSACSGNQWSLQGQRRRWTPAFFLVATLAIMSAVLLVGLILIVVRRGARRFLIFDDKEELLPADEWSFAHSPKTVLE